MVRVIVRGHGKKSPSQLTLDKMPQRTQAERRIDDQIAVTTFHMPNIAAKKRMYVRFRYQRDAIAGALSHKPWVRDRKIQHARTVTAAPSNSGLFPSNSNLIAPISDRKSQVGRIVANGWKVDGEERFDDAPDAVDIIRCQLSLDDEESSLRAGLQQGYERELSEDGRSWVE
jgi:hypothetical protein